VTTRGRAALVGALLPPLRFAARDDFARVDRLKGFESMALSALDDHVVPPSDGPALSEKETLRALVAGFDAATTDERRRRARALLGVLDPPKGDVDEGPQAARALPLPAPVASTIIESKERPRPAPRPAREARAPSKAREAREDSEVSAAVDDEPVESMTPAAPLRALRAPTDDAKRATDWLAMPITALPGIGPKRAALFLSRDVSTVGALLHLLPRTYEDRRTVSAIQDLTTGMNTVARGRVVSAGRVARKKGSRFHVVLDDGTGRLTLVFFRFREAEFLRRFTVGAEITCAGEVARFQGLVQIVHPLVVEGDAASALTGVWPVYPELKGLHPAEIARAARAALALLDRSPPRDLLPERVREEAEVPTLHRALKEIHAPDDDIDAARLRALVARKTPWHLRLAFEEIFVFELALALRKDEGTRDRASPIRSVDALALAKEILPFSLTGAQRRATDEVLRDLAAPHPMGRLLQGDVGSGKTAVAALAVAATVKAGLQACVLAPTSIVAEQHAATFARLFAPHGIRVELFTGGQRGKARNIKLARLKNREIPIAVGTHALLTDDVQFAALGLAVIDEQHRFGVGQRLVIRDRGPRDDDGVPIRPHLLAMTATPIPRSLALTLYGDLSVSVLDELPPGRTPVTTRVLFEGQLERAMQAIEHARARGERTYVVYPLIEESEKLDLADATRGFDDIRARFGDESTALVHGRMPTEERERAMARFVRGEVSILVSTTVIEVGVDVREATLMIVRHAERFGLSQLHQLRGRVGRSDKPSTCLLIVGDDGAGRDAAKRLAIMEESTDGFRIAEEDLAIRGPGDFLGTRQSGLPAFAFTDLAAHAALIARAKEIATRFVVDDPALTRHEELRALVFERFRDRLTFTESG